MSAINNGGPAFPESYIGADMPHEGVGNGMSLRDYAAIKVLPAIYADAMKGDVSGLFSSPDWRIGLALDAYKMADAMLKAREVPV
jgi:hypothetical protein